MVLGTKNATSMSLWVHALAKLKEMPDFVKGSVKQPWDSVSVSGLVLFFISPQMIQTSVV